MADEEYRRLRPMCSAPDCARPTQARALCNTHYSRLWKTGSIDPREPTPPPTCSVDSCGLIATRKGLCGKHYARARYRPKPPKPPSQTIDARRKRARKMGIQSEVLPCGVAGCTIIAARHGLCSAHWHRQCRYGNASAAICCSFCGRSVPLGAGLEYCSSRCRKRAKSGLPNEADCLVCGRSFRVVERAVTCSTECSQARRLATEREWTNKRKQDPDYLARRRMVQQRRRARVCGLGVELFTFDEIAARDKWRCQLCGEQVDRRTRHPDPKSGSIDHIVPIVKGGAHTRMNVQLTHLLCNMRKHSKVQGQLLLVG